MIKYRHLAWVLPLFFVQCTKKLNSLPEYKTTEGIAIDSAVSQPTCIEYDQNYTYILDNSYNFRLFYRIDENTGKLENLPKYNTLYDFTTDSLNLYIVRANTYPKPLYTLYKVPKNNLNDSTVINQNYNFVGLSFHEGSLYAWNLATGLCKINPITGEYSVILSRDNFYISQVSFLKYKNASKFHNGKWMFINQDGGYFTSVSLAGGTLPDTLNNVKTRLFAVVNDRIYFTQQNTHPDVGTNPLLYQSCLASIPLAGGQITIEDSVNIKQCNTVSNYGNLLLIGDGRFIKTFDPITKKVEMLGAMTATTYKGQILDAYPFSNKYTGSVYYSAYYEITKLYKLK